MTNIRAGLAHINQVFNVAFVYYHIIIFSVLHPPRETLEYIDLCYNTPYLGPRFRAFCSQKLCLEVELAHFLLSG